MPYLPKHICAMPGCTELTMHTYCQAHAYMSTVDRGIKRASATQRGYNTRWQKVSKMYLKEHPICECPVCAKLGRHTTANVVHYVIPHHGNQELFWDEENWQAMNKKCHDRHTLFEMRQKAADNRQGAGRGV